jgi:hypothetical protein
MNVIARTSLAVLFASALLLPAAARAGLVAPLVPTGPTGLDASFYNAPFAGANAAFSGGFLGFNNYLAALGAPAFTSLTSAGGVTALSFDPVSPADPLFAVFGFNGLDNVVARMKGQISIATAGTYTFGTTSDDGSILFIDGAKVVDNNFLQIPTRRSGSILLSAGLHAIDLGYFEGLGGNNLIVDWAGPGISGTQVLPNAVLSPSPIPEPGTLGFALVLTGVCFSRARGRRGARSI